MLRQFAFGAAAAAMLVLPCAVARAEPDAPCTAETDGAMTWPAGAKAPLDCVNGSWNPVVDPYPISEKWASGDTTVTLHGQGRPNPNLLSGAWTATPLTPETTCAATQAAVVPGSPTVGPPRVDQAPPGRPLSFDVVPVLFTIELSGDCLWQKRPD